MNQVTLTQEQYNELKSHSAMLGQIGSYVDTFCKGDEDTTLNGVLRLLAEYYNLLSEYHYSKLEQNSE